MATTLDTGLPFDAGAGAVVTEGQWRSLAERWLTDGVVAGVTNELAVAQRAAGANMSVDVATGEARVQGHQGVSTSVKNLTIAANGSGNPRVDLVVIRADFANNRIELDVLTGTAAAAPVEPTVTQSASVWEIPIAAIDVANGASSIVTANLRDRRSFTRTVTQLAWKEPVRAATTTALAASTVSGTKRTANANGALGAMDTSVTLVAGDRILDKDHATGAQRGIWKLVDPGSASRPWVFERPADFDETADLRDGSYVTVAEGTLYAGTGWLQTATNPLTLGTTSQTWTQFPPAAAVAQASEVARVDTSEVVTSAASEFKDAATAGPAVTVTVPASGKVLVTVGCTISTGGANTGGNMGFVLSGANTLAASTLRSQTVFATNDTGLSIAGSRAILLSGLTPGSTTFTAKYRSTSAGTGISVANREIAVVTLP